VQFDAKISTNGTKAFFDTNVLLYLYSQDHRTKQARAKELFDRYTLYSRALVSSQVIQEFYVVGSQKLHMPHHEMRIAVEDLLGLPLVFIGPTEILSAIHIEERYRISFWDALILAAAASGGAEVVFTEDLNDGQKYGSVTVRNPFRGEITA